MYRDGARKSIWQEEIRRFSSEADLHQLYDVAVVGGGITGVSTALKLQQSGKRCILLEAANIGFGTTGGTTAHLNDFFDTTFNQAISDFGQENVEEIPFPIPFKEAVTIPNQAQFHPVKYIKGLCEAFISLGGIILEECRCESHDEQENEVVLETSKGEIKAKNVVYATHIPPGLSILHITNAPYRSYAIAFSLKNGNYPKDLGYDLIDPYHYYRTQEIDGQTLLIAGGEDHKTGHEEDTGECFSRLENYVRKYFDVETAYYSWSSQYYEPTDGFPYIGKLPGSSGRIFTATGFRGIGMIFGTISSQILSDLIVTGSSKYENVFSPSRIKPIAGFADFVKENAVVAYDFIKDKLFAEKINSLAEVKEGDAKVVKYEGESYALYKETNGKVHLVKSTCPHAKCEVRWNSAELSWDCPCHGSRFNVNGKLLTGPTVRDLPRVDTDSEM